MNSVKLLISVALVAIVALLVPGVRPADSAMTREWCGAYFDSCGNCGAPGVTSQKVEFQPPLNFSCCKQVTVTMPSHIPPYNPVTRSFGIVTPSKETKYKCRYETSLDMDCFIHEPIGSANQVPSCPPR